MGATGRILFLFLAMEWAVLPSPCPSHPACCLEMFPSRLALSDRGDGLQSGFLFQMFEVFIPGHISEQTTSAVEFQSSGADKTGSR